MMIARRIILFVGLAVAGISCDEGADGPSQSPAISPAVDADEPTQFGTMSICTSEGPSVDGLIDALAGGAGLTFANDVRLGSETEFIEDVAGGVLQTPGWVVTFSDARGLGPNVVEDLTLVLTDPSRATFTDAQGNSFRAQAPQAPRALKQLDALDGGDAALLFGRAGDVAVVTEVFPASSTEIEFSDGSVVDEEQLMKRVLERREP